MSFTICLLVAFLLADAAQLFETEHLSKSHSPLTCPEEIKVFKHLLHRALDSKDTHHRDLLITAGVVPAPPGYENLKDERAGKPQERNVSPEIEHHFNEHIKDILTSLEKIGYALNRLFEERLLHNHFEGLKESWQLKPMEDFKSYQSKEKDYSVDALPDLSEDIGSKPDEECNAESNSAACNGKQSELKLLPSEDNFKVISDFEVDSENDFVTSSVVDKITKEYVKIFSEVTEPPNIHELSTSGQMEVTLSPLDEDFIMHVMSSSVSPAFSEFSSSDEEETTTATDTDSRNTEASEAESYSASLPPIFGRVLTYEEVRLLDKSLSLKPELKYQIISKSQPDQDTLSNLHFLTNEEDSSSKPISKKRRRVNPRDISLEDPIFYQAPTPQKMIMRYYRDIPDTSFTCENKSIPGFYADLETDCQVFHVCWPGRRESFLCPVGSLFNQKVLSCDNFNKTNCSLSHAYFDVNTAFQEYDDAKAHNVTPRPDPMMKPIQNDSGTTEVVATKPDIVELFEADLHFSEMVNKTSIAELWDYMPVKAKVFVYPEPAELKKFLEEQHHHKIRKSKDVRGLESTTEMKENTDEEILDEVLEKRHRIEANIIRVLKKLSRKHRD